MLLGWGDDLESAKAMLEERNLSDRVLAAPIVGKRRLLKYLQAANVVIEQFVLGYYGGSGLEAMACGTPVIMRLERDQYDALVEIGAPPVLDAENGSDVERHLDRLYYNPALAQDVGRRAREWFLGAQSSRRWSDTYRVLLQAMAAGIPLSAEASPLREPLSEREREYHSAQLVGAPPFPHYVDP